MIEQHPCFLPPDDPQVRLWRYMDFPKFLSLLQTCKLYFPRADQLGDPFEGASSYANFRLGQLAESNDEIRERLYPSVSADAVRRMNEASARGNKEMVKLNFVSCWHAGNHESAAMWDRYGRSGDAIALQTTFEKLANELPHEVHMGRVEYIDYDQDFIDETNMFNRFMRKRRSFEHEKEIRAIIWAMRDVLPGGKSVDGRIEIGEYGATVSVNLLAITERIYVGPTAPAYYADVVRDVVSRYHLEIPVQQSRLADPPVY